MPSRWACRSPSAVTVERALEVTHQPQRLGEVEVRGEQVLGAPEPLELGDRRAQVLGARLRVAGIGDDEAEHRAGVGRLPAAPAASATASASSARPRASSWRCSAQSA